ncbi:MAG: hypothetical protein ACLPXT_09340 [Terracidiphilus sp.]
MTDSLQDPPLTLAEAEDEFSQFLSSNGFPSRIRWITAEQIVMGEDRHHFISALGAETDHAQASRRYTEGLKKGLGILLRAFCSTPSQTIAGINIPTDPTDAQYRHIGRGLKLSCPTSLIPASIVEDPIEWQHPAADFYTRFEMMRRAYDL